MNRATNSVTSFYSAIAVTGNQMLPAFWALFHNLSPLVEILFSLYYTPNTTFVIFHLLLRLNYVLKIA